MPASCMELPLSVAGAPSGHRFLAGKITHINRSSTESLSSEAGAAGRWMVTGQCAQLPRTVFAAVLWLSVWEVPCVASVVPVKPVLRVVRQERHWLCLHRVSTWPLPGSWVVCPFGSLNPWTASLPTVSVREADQRDMRHRNYREEQVHVTAGLAGRKLR